MALVGLEVRSEAGPFGLAAVCLGARRWEYAFRTGYDGRGRVSTTHVVERGYSAMLTQAE